MMRSSVSRMRSRVSHSYYHSFMSIAQRVKKTSILLIQKETATFVAVQASSKQKVWAYNIHMILCPPNPKTKHTRDKESSDSKPYRALFGYLKQLFNEIEKNNVHPRNKACYFLKSSKLRITYYHLKCFCNHVPLCEI